MGPTASGKTALAIRLAQAFPCDLISVDSALVYRGMDIGSAKPTAAEQATAPHRLIDICDPAEAYSAGQFREDCFKAIADIHAVGRVPLLVGGTMLYFRALAQMDELPQSDPDLRLALQQQLATDGLAALVADLQALDPAGAALVELQNPQRVMRALEMVRLSGQSLTTLWQGRTQGQLPWPVLKLAIAPPREVLHKRIAARLDQMFAAGFVEEVAGLFARGDLSEGLPSIRAVGYRQVWQALQGEHDLDKAKELALYATRQLAKRQLTWLRKEEDLNWVDSSAENWEQKLLDTVAAFLGEAGV